MVDQRLSATDMDLLRARAARYATSDAGLGRTIDTVMSFRRGKCRYAAPLTNLLAVRPLTSLCSLLGTNKVVPGVIHHQGKLVSVHDLSAYMGSPSEEPAHWLLILEDREECVSILCDEVLDVLVIRDGDLSPVPISFESCGEGFTGLYQNDIVVLDVALLLGNNRFMDAY